MEKTMAEEEPLLKEEDRNKKGGFRTLPFIIGNESVEKMATYGVMPNMALYLIKEYHMELTTASNVLFMWSSATNFMPLVAALLADSFFGRFYTIGFGSIICFMGMILLWSTTIIPQAKPPPCSNNPICTSVAIPQLVLLCTSFVLISIGAGGIRSSSLAFGADQLEKAEFKRKSNLKESYFTWYYASYTLSVLIALTSVVYIQDNVGWGVGFLVPTLLMLFGVGSFFLASPFYVKLKCRSSSFTGLVQVVVASFNNRSLELSDGTSNYYTWHCRSGSSLVCPSEKLRFLNKACVVRDPETDLTPDGRPKNRWRLCTVDQVEELKSTLKILPIWSTGMIMSINISQTSFPVIQASSMNRRITSNFTIPSASFSTITVISVILWIFLYDRIFLPLASRVMRRPIRISPKTRMGIGIFFSILAMIATSAVEGVRRSLHARSGGSQMSAVWLVPQYCLTGFAEASNVIAQNEFYFSEFPRSMSSVALTMNGIGMSLANLIASFLMNFVDWISKKGGKESWISSDINKGRYDYYYLVLAGLSVANMIYFLVCSSAYGPLKGEKKLEEEQGEVL